ncbi:MAG: hypothetical protein ACOC46_04180, partial [Pirellulales bacterium]
MSPWIDLAVDALATRQSAAGGWGYQFRGEPFVEPTGLAGLALAASAPGGAAGPLARRAADWMAEIQNADGSLGPSAEVSAPGWGTSHAVLLWAAVGGHEAERRSAVQWLLGLEGETWQFDRENAVGHDPSIPGWPWVAGTHSWLEPTCLALLALRREGMGAHPRAGDGIRVVRDRAISTGGWNYGNSGVFGKSLRAQPAPTGIALLALAGTQAPDRLIKRACGYLGQVLPRVRAPRSLGWGLLGLDAWGRRPAEAEAWLEESFARLRRSRP